MVGALASKVEAAGAEVLSFELSDLSYAPEIAQSMLVRQKAQALVDARRIVIEGAVEIVKGAISHLGEAGFEIDPGRQSKIVGNLLAIICGEAKVQPSTRSRTTTPRASGFLCPRRSHILRRSSRCSRRKRKGRERPRWRRNWSR